MQIEARNSRLRPRTKALVSATLFLNVFQGCVFMQYLSNLRFGLYGSCSLLVRDVSFAALVELSAVLSSSVRSEFRQVSVRRQVKTCSRPVPAFLPCLSPSGKTQNSSAVTYTPSQKGLHLTVTLFYSSLKQRHN